MAKCLPSATSCRVVCFECAFCDLTGTTRDRRRQHLMITRIRSWQHGLGRSDMQLGSERRSAGRRFLRRSNPQSYTDVGSAGNLVNDNVVYHAQERGPRPSSFPLCRLMRQNPGVSLLLARLVRPL
jgi:hypothetical protein